MKCTNFSVYLYKKPKGSYYYLFLSRNKTLLVIFWEVFALFITKIKLFWNIIFRLVCFSSKSWIMSMILLACYLVIFFSVFPIRESLLQICFCVIILVFRIQSLFTALNATNERVQYKKHFFNSWPFKIKISTRWKNLKRL